MEPTPHPSSPTGSWCDLVLPRPTGILIFIFFELFIFGFQLQCEVASGLAQTIAALRKQRTGSSFRITAFKSFWEEQNDWLRVWD